MINHAARKLCRRFPCLIQPRLPDSHKGTYGNVAIVGGATGMSGAVILASSAALLMGCGKSYAVFCQKTLPLPVLPGYPEVMLQTAEQFGVSEKPTVIAVGCGMGTSDEAADILEKCIRLSRQNMIPLLLDADALNIIAKQHPLARLLKDNPANKILTPHPAEAARLLTCSVTDIQHNRPAAAQQLAARFHARVVLKGHHSIICTPDGQYHLNDSGNAGLATAGSGDVLTGMLAGLLAQNPTEDNLIRAGVWLHGMAAEIQGNGTALVGLLAGEIAPTARKLRHCAMLEAVESSVISAN